MNEHIDNPKATWSVIDPPEIRDIDLLLSDPVAWYEKQAKQKARRIYDENFSHRQRIEDVYRDFEKSIRAAYWQLVSFGKIEEGDTPPWLAGNSLHEFATKEQERVSSIFESFLKSLGMR